MMLYLIKHKTFQKILKWLVASNNLYKYLLRAHYWFNKRQIQDKYQFFILF